MTQTTTLGELIVALYEQYQAVYRNDDLAAVAAAASLNELFVEAALDEPTEVEAA